MPDQIAAEIALPTTLQERLAAEDDPALWEQVLKVLADDASTLDIAGSPLYAEIGRCSHWFRPHQTRWTAAGGFALPVGYGHAGGFPRRALPNFDWSVTLLYIPESSTWETPPAPARKRALSIRVAVPSRTVRHHQAAVNTQWPPRTLNPRRNRAIFYGFRNVNGVWELKARTKERDPEALHQT
jgi:hypothetical protein